MKINQRTTIGSYIPTGTSGSVLFIDANGKLAQDNNYFWDNVNKRLGIGTDSPDKKLHINSNNAMMIGTGTDEDVKLITVDVSNVPFIGWDESQNAFRFSDGFNLVGGGSAKVGIYSDFNNNGAVDDASLFFFIDGYPGSATQKGKIAYDGGLDRVVVGYGNNNNIIIDQDGKVGINETSPSAMLHTKSTSATNITAIFKGATSQSANLTEWQDSVGNVLGVVDSDGKLGIGTSNPPFTLSVYGQSGSSGLFRTESDGTYNSTNFYANSDTNWQGNFFAAYRSRGTRTSKTPVSVNDTILLFDVWARDSGNVNRRAGQFNAIVDKIGTGYAGARWQWYCMDSSYTNRLMFTVATSKIDINVQNQDADLQVRGTTDDYLIKTDAANDRVGIGLANPLSKFDVRGDTRLGNSSATYMDIESNGDTFWVGSGTGVPYGEISAMEAYETITITATGEANKVQITTFDTNGISNLTTPDHTNDHITISKTGVYRISCNINADSVAGASAAFGFSVYKNNGATLVDSLHGHKNYSGGGGQIASINMNGIASLTAGDTIEVWVWNYDNTQNIIIDDINLNLNMIGG